MDEAVVGRVRDLRDQVKNTVARLRSAKNTDRIRARRDRRRKGSAGQRPPGGPGAASRSWSRPAANADSGAGEDRRASRRSSTATSPRSRVNSPRQLAGYGSVAASRRPDRARQRQRPDLAGQRRRRLRLRPRAGDGCTRASTSRCRPAPRSAPPPPARVILSAGRIRKRRLRQLHLPRTRRRAADLLRAPVGLRRRLRAERLPGRRDRLRRLHRALLRRPPPFRGAGQRRADRPARLPLGVGTRPGRTSGAAPEVQIFGMPTGDLPWHAG